MRNPEESELIEKYLSDDLAKEERMLFEKRLSADQELLEMVYLHQTLLRELGDAKQLGLLNSLREITEKPYRKTFIPNIKQVVTAILLLLACIWCFLAYKPGNSSRQITAPEPVTPDVAPVIDTPKITPATPLASLNPADFQPNPSLEGLVGTSFRGDEPVRAYFAKPEQASRLLSRNGAVRVTMKGSILTTESIVSKDFTLIVYSNRETDFNAGKYLFSTQTIIQPASDGEFLFSTSPLIKLKPGLYYIVLTETGFSEPVAVTSFRVEQEKTPWNQSYNSFFNSTRYPTFSPSAMAISTTPGV